MKKIIPILLCLCLLSGCSASVSIIGGADAPQTEVLKAERVVEVPSESTVRSAFDKAIEVYGWFDLCTMDLDYNDKVTEGDREFYRVMDTEINTYEKLRTLVYELFSIEIGDALLKESEKNQHYKDINGVLYAQDGARGADITKGDYTYTVEIENARSVVCHVEVENIDFNYNDPDNYRVVTGMTKLDFHYAYQPQNDRWVFTDFKLFY